MKNIIELKGITKSFDGERVLKGIDLEIKEGEFLTLLGPSGCGKTTILRLIGGFDTPDSGDIIFDGKKINHLPPYKRELNTVFQKYALFPHLNVYDNIAFGLKIKNMDKKEIDKRVNHNLELVGLRDYGSRRIDKLSGGQQQRIAIARALVNEPKVLLLDEPLGALDLKLRKGMQVELKEIQKEVGITFIFVTHDQEEALTMSDKIVVMKKGAIQQIGSPIDIYNEPKNAFVADFIGESNILEGTMIKDLEVSFLGRKFECVDKGFGENKKVQVVIRPEDVDLVAKDKGMLVGRVESLIFMGVHYEMKINVNGFDMLVHSINHSAVGEEVGINIIPDAIHIMEAEDEV